MSEQSQADVDRRIEDFLAANVAIPNTARGAASKSQNRLREILANKSTPDATFPHLLSRVDEDFLGGSFARHTKIWPLDDIDIYFPIDGAGLFYVQNGGRLPFSLLTDNPSRPQRLLNAEWLRGQYIGSDLVLSGFLKAVAQAYPNSKLRGDQHAVCLGTTVAATSESVGIGFDIVPCFCLAPDGGGTNIYLIPDGCGSWLRTNRVLTQSYARICMITITRRSARSSGSSNTGTRMGLMADSLHISSSWRLANAFWNICGWGNPCAVSVRPLPGLSML
jgi:hypothetical protein